MSFFIWRASDGAPQEFEKEAGDSGKERPIHGLPALIANAIVATAASCAGIVAALSTLQTFVDGLETLITATNTSLGPATATYGGRKLVAAAGTREVLGTSQAFTKGLWVRALTTNLGLAYVGDSTVSGSAGGTDLSPGEAVWCDAANRNMIYVDVAVSGEGVKYWGW